MVHRDLEWRLHGRHDEREIAGSPGAGIVFLLSGAGQGQYLPPGTAEQELNAGAGVAGYLAFIVTPVQAPFEIAVDHPV